MSEREDAVATVKFSILCAIAASGERIREPEKLRDAIYKSLFDTPTLWALVVCSSEPTEERP